MFRNFLKLVALYFQAWRKNQDLVSYLEEQSQQTLPHNLAHNLDTISSVSVTLLYTREDCSDLDAQMEAFMSRFN